MRIHLVILASGALLVGAKATLAQDAIQEQDFASSFPDDLNGSPRPCAHVHVQKPDGATTGSVSTNACAEATCGEVRDSSMAPAPAVASNVSYVAWNVADAIGADTPGEHDGSLSRLDLRSQVSEPFGRPVLRDTSYSPLDSLRMSPWERIWWGRRGLMRKAGLFPTHPDEPLDDLRQVAHVRRRMLQWHQTAGLITVASMATTVVGGQLAASGHGSTLHRASLPITIGLYSTTAALALLSPPKPIHLDRPGDGIDSITIHKWLAVGHVAGMLITPLLGDDAGRAHYAMGYATFATFSAAMLTVTLLRR